MLSVSLFESDIQIKTNFPSHIAVTHDDGVDNQLEMQYIIFLWGCLNKKCVKNESYSTGNFSLH